MTEPSREPEEFLLRFHGTHLAPAYQPGDVLTVREATTAQDGQLALVVTNHEGDTGIRKYHDANGHRVIGVVTAMHRRIPGAGS